VQVLDRIGSFKVISLLGKGSWADVYKVISEEPGSKPCALKLFRTPLSSSSGLPVRRFRREFRALSKLDHPNIVKVYNQYELEGRLFYTMELVDGNSLEEYINGSEPPSSHDQYFSKNRMKRLSSCFHQILLSLDYLHSNYIVHRDLKPSNILVTRDGIVKLADFGLAKCHDMDSRTSTEGAIIGTTMFMSPEQIRGGEIDGRSDLYSLGIILYRLTTGKLPFEGENLYTILFKHLSEPPIPPSTTNPAIDSSLERIILRALKKAPAFRFLSAKQFFDDMEIYFSTTEFDIDKTVDKSLQDTTERLTFYNPPFIGRDFELHILTNSVKEAMNGTSKVIMLEGAPGMGKTRLGTELESLVKLLNVHFYWGQSFPEQREPFQIFKNILEDLLAKTAEWSEEDLTQVLGKESYLLQDYIPGISWRETYNKISTVYSPEISHLDYKNTFLMIFYKLFLYCSPRNPSIFFLDDLQWADELSIQFLEYLLNQIFENHDQGPNTPQIPPLLFILSIRQGEAHENQFLMELFDRLKTKRFVFSHQLKPFTENESKYFISSFFGQDNLPKSFISLVFKEGEGVPFYMKEIMRSMVETKQITIQENELISSDQDLVQKPIAGIDVYPSLPIPGTVKDSIKKRLAKLSPAVQEVLEACSILGKEFDIDLVMKTLDKNEDSLLDILNYLINIQILKESKIVTEERFQFYHDKFREVVIAELAPKQRKILHLKVAAVLEDLQESLPENLLPSLAYHYYYAGSLEKAFVYSEKTALKFKSQSMNSDAVFYYNQCIDIISKMQTRNIPVDELKNTGILFELGNLYNLIGQPREALDCFRRMLQEAERHTDVQNQANALLGIGTIQITSGNQEEGKENIEKAKSNFIAADDKVGEARCINNLGIFYYNSGLYEKAGDMTKTLIQVSRQKNFQRGILAGNTNLGLIYILVGRSSQALKYFNENLEIYEKDNNQGGIALTLKGIATAYDDLGKTEEAVKLCTRAIEILTRTGDLKTLAETYIKYGECYLELNKPRKAYRYFRKAFSLESIEYNPEYIISCYMFMGSIQALHFRKQAVGEEKILKAIELARKHDKKEHLAYALLELGKVQLGDGKL